MTNVLDTLLAGCAGGIAQVLAGQPFDLLKVRLQSGSFLANGMTDCFKKIVTKEGGILSLWKGSLPPLMSVGASVSIQFGVNEKLRTIIRKMNGSSKLSVSQNFQCGVMAGLANSIVSIPSEHGKIKMQMQNNTVKGQRSGSIHYMKEILKNYGVRGLYKGGVPTMLREGMAFGVYFSFYEFMINQLLKPGQLRSELGTSSVMLCGGLTGVACWIASYPIDIVKTKIQIDSLSNPVYRGTLDCVQKIYREKGAKGFYKGFSPCLVRAVPANAATFLGYEAALKVISMTRKKMF